MRFVLEFVTDAFLGGANQEASTGDGLRPPSVRALIRFAWRALHLGLPLDQLATEEATLLGDCERGQGVQLRPHRQKVCVLPAADLRYRERSLAYLGYGPVKSKGEARRAAVAARSFADLSLLRHPPLPDKQQEDLVAAIWLAGALFGLGSRSRRGFGSTQVAGWDGPRPPAPWPATCSEPAELADAWRKFLQKIQPTARGETADWTGITRETRIFVWKKPYGRWQEALDAVGEGLHVYRQRLGAEGQKSRFLGPDHDLAYAIAEGREVHRAPERAAFGLPHNYNLHLRGKRTTLNIGPKNDGDRRASPLLLHVTQLRTGEYLPVVGYLPARLLAPGVELEMKAGGVCRVVPPPGDGAIQRFLDGGEIEGRHERGSDRPAEDSTWHGLSPHATEVSP